VASDRFQFPIVRLHHFFLLRANLRLWWEAWGG
jgi:hypothetical protein